MDIFNAPCEKCNKSMVEKCNDCYENKCPPCAFNQMEKVDRTTKKTAIVVIEFDEEAKMCNSYTKNYGEIDRHRFIGALMSLIGTITSDPNNKRNQ